MSVTGYIVDPSNPRSMASRARAARWQMLQAEHPRLAEYRVLDIGGTIDSWALAPIRPRELVFLNIPTQAGRDQERGTNGTQIIVGDACDPPAELLEERFDLVYSNSVIEHVGGHARRVAFADTVTTIGEHYWVQTPNRYFPLEPHAIMPGLQFLPAWAKARAVRRWPLGGFRRYSRDWPQPVAAGDDSDRFAGLPLRQVPEYHAMRTVLGTELLSTSELAFYFPQARIVRERVLGLTKSLIATR